MNLLKTPNKKIKLIRSRSFGQPKAVLRTFLVAPYLNRQENKINMERYQTLIPFLFLAVMHISPSHAQIYKWIDADGEVQFSDKKPLNKKSENVNLKINTYKNVTIDPEILKDTKYFNKNNIAYIEYDIDNDKAAKKRHKAMGATGVPVIFIGDRRMNGFSAASFERIYNNQYGVNYDNISIK